MAQLRETRRFPNSPSSITQARRYVEARLGGLPKNVVDAVALMTSELATNSIRHTATEFEVSIDVKPPTIRIEVSDRGSGMPTVLSPDPSEPSGRGMHIVARLADDWGVTPVKDRNAKTVWFTVALPALR